MAEKIEVGVVVKGADKATKQIDGKSFSSSKNLNRLCTFDASTSGVCPSSLTKPSITCFLRVAILSLPFHSKNLHALVTHKIYLIYFVVLNTIEVSHV